MSEELTVVEVETKQFELAQRQASVYAKSTLVPKEYRDNIGNVLIAQNMAKRMGADALSVMQNLYIVHGKPGWSAQFLIACFNSCGRFTSIKYRFTGERGKDSWGCIAHATEREGGEVLEGTEVTLKMAKDEGWYSKSGSKWKTMPEQMLRYRAAAFFIRAVAPDIGLGMMTQEELRDVHSPQANRGVASIQALLGEPEDEADVDADDVKTVDETPENFDLDEVLSLANGATTVAELDTLLESCIKNYPHQEGELMEVFVSRREAMDAEEDASGG